MSLKLGVMTVNVICKNNSAHRLCTSRVLVGVKMPSSVQKWQTWGLVTAYKVMLEDHGTCQNCRQIMWEQAEAWGIADEILKRQWFPHAVDNNGDESNVDN